MSTKYSAGAFSFAMLLLRLGLGLTMLLAHGLDKLQHFSKYSQAFADPFHIGRMTSLSLDIFAEFFCSCLIILGLLTRLACIPLIIAMLVAFVYVHHEDAFNTGERATLFLTGLVTLLILGPGRYSVDAAIGK